MKTGFRDPLEQQKGQVKNTKNIWNFEAPPYDERSSSYISAGTDYGVGRVQPIGTKNHSSADGIPKGRVNTLSQYPTINNKKS